MSGSISTAGRLRASTPASLLRFMAAIVAAALLAAAVSLWCAGGIRDAAQTVGRDAEPSVALALRMEATLGDMNAASIADSLYDTGEVIGTSLAFQNDLAMLAADIVEASRNITYGEAEAVPLRELTRAVLQYQRAVTEAATRGQGNLWLTSHRLQWASRLNQGFAIPQAEALAQANAAELETRYGVFRANSLVYAAAGLAAFALLVTVQLAAQLWLAQRMRRWVNPALAAATVLATAAGLWFAASVLDERANLRAAKSDAYDSLHVLFEAKAAANALRADFSLWLLDTAARPEAEVRMKADIAALIGVDLSRGADVRPLTDGLDAALAAERRGEPDRALAEAPHLDGLLGKELGNITFGVPEREAATQTVARLIEAAALIRALQANDAHEHALVVAGWLDDRHGGGGAIFAALQAALDRTIEVNQIEFDRRVAAALRTAALVPFVTCGALAAAAVLSVVGLWLRLREYS